MEGDGTDTRTVARPEEPGAADRAEEEAAGGDDELPRRLVHLSGSLLPFAYVLNVLTWSQVQAVLAVAAIGVVAMETVRLTVGLDWVIFEALTRSYEQDNPAGYALAVVAAAAVVLLFSPPVAVAALLMLTVGDPFAGVLGSASVDGRKRFAVVGATFLLCLTIGLVFLPPRAAIPAAATATVADAVKPRVFGFVVDDNFSIPLGAAVAGALGLAFLPAVFCVGPCLDVFGVI
jgi:dolichol kinase